MHEAACMAFRNKDGISTIEIAAFETMRGTQVPTKKGRALLLASYPATARKEVETGAFSNRTL